MSTPPSYAPTATTSFAPSSTATNYHQELLRTLLVPTTVHKAVYDALGEIYALATVLEMVETAFVKDHITDKEKYTATVMRLINQYHMLVQGLGKSPTHALVLAEILPGVAADRLDLLQVLQAKFNLHAPLAADRLVLGIPATIQHLHTVVGSTSEASTAVADAPAPAASARLVAEATGNFITLMDALKLNYNTKAQLHPLLSDLVISLNDLVTRENGASKPVDFAGKSKLVSWLIKLNNLAEALLADECEAFLADLDAAYRGFYNSLE